MDVNEISTQYKYSKIDICLLNQLNLFKLTKKYKLKNCWTFLLF